MDDRPACTQCDACKLRIERNAQGWEAYCTFLRKGGKLIAWQYGTQLAWAKTELLDKLNARISPRWCPQRGKGEKE